MKTPSQTKKPPTYAVIFTAHRTDIEEGYNTSAEKLKELVDKQPGYLGMESAAEGSFEVTISYWTDLESIAQWKSNREHLLAQQNGRKKWYSDYQVEIAKIERAYGYASPGES